MTAEITRLRAALDDALVLAFDLAWQGTGTRPFSAEWCDLAISAYEDFPAEYTRLKAIADGAS